MSYQVSSGKGPSPPLIRFRGGRYVCIFSPCCTPVLRGTTQPNTPSVLRLRSQAGRRHPPGEHTCRRCCPGSCESRCSSSSECLWLRRRVRRGRLALCSASRSLFSSVAVAFFSSGDCNQPPSHESQLTRGAEHLGAGDEYNNHSLRASELEGRLEIVGLIPSF